jgi:hypothetical protein
MSETRPKDFRTAAAKGGSPGLVAELGRFLWQTKKWWMVPIILTLLLLGVLIYLSGSAAAPFIYTLF